MVVAISELFYALPQGSIAIAGAAIKWLRDNMGLVKESAEVGELAAKVSDTAGVYFVPAFSGLFAPYWRDDARGYCGVDKLSCMKFVLDVICSSIFSPTASLSGSRNIQTATTSVAPFSKQLASKLVRSLKP